MCLAYANSEEIMSDFCLPVIFFQPLSPLTLCLLVHTLLGGGGAFSGFKLKQLAAILSSGVSSTFVILSNWWPSLISTDVIPSQSHPEDDAERPPLSPALP